MFIVKLISWNVGGIDKRYENGELDEIFKLNPDLFCIQELKQKSETFNPTKYKKEGYESYFYPTTEDKSDWGTGTYTKIEPISLTEGINVPKFDTQGRIQKFEFDEFELYNVYFPSEGTDSCILNLNVNSMMSSQIMFKNQKNHK